MAISAPACWVQILDAPTDLHAFSEKGGAVTPEVGDSTRTRSSGPTDGPTPHTGALGTPGQRTGRTNGPYTPKASEQRCRNDRADTAEEDQKIGFPAAPDGVELRDAHGAGRLSEVTG